ncbi:argininosuccinate lyase [Coleophoma crateriformis]|uniref:Arginosuccinase n=1 Tax=Coleophoma crateriformis TaxID=565419 RepID=A0A3D8RQF9_9HELO|nr:argininosuccinate lyase [Coleophoma crateriformis]
MSSQAALSATTRHDNFFWLGEINKATAVINVDEGLLERAVVPRIARGLQKVLQDGQEPGAKRPKLVIKFEPLLIAAAGLEATMLHAGRSSQDMLATARFAILREATLCLAEQLRETTACMVQLAEDHTATVVPNYTNGVAAQPNSYGHYLLGHVAGLERDAQRLREFYIRLDRSPMGTTVLNGTSWPLNRDRMAAYLGFATTVDNAYDAAQILATEISVELGALAMSIALHAGAFIQDVMVQYAQPRPWILLEEGGNNTYVSSAMPQKRNPGLLNRTRGQASQIVTLGIGRAIQAHNIPPGMGDNNRGPESIEVVDGVTQVLADWKQILQALVINPDRALEELNNDWTASQEVADVLMRQYKLPFRVGHHFSSEVVSYAKAHNIRPSDFSYVDAQRIYTQTLEDMKFAGGQFPMTEEEFRATLDPVAIIRNRVTAGGPQPSEMSRMLTAAKQTLSDQLEWIQARRGFIEDSLTRLSMDFEQLL